MLWAIAASLVPKMQKGDETARSAHIAINAVILGLFTWQVSGHRHMCACSLLHGDCVHTLCARKLVLVSLCISAHSLSSQRFKLTRGVWQLPTGFDILMNVWNKVAWVPAVVAAAPK